MSIQSLRTSLELLNTTPGAQSSSITPSRTIYHEIARDVMLIQGIHYVVEEALANVGELGSSGLLLDPNRRCLLRLQQNLIDIAKISENIQESMLHNIINQAPTSQAPIEEEPTQSVADHCESVPLPTTSVPTHTFVEDSGKPIVSRLEPLPCLPGWEQLVSSPSENLMSQVIPDRDRRSKREAPNDDNPQPPPAKRPRFSSSGSIYLRPTYRERERTSVFGWARGLFTAPRQ